MPPSPRVGVWLMGGRGSVATTAIVGAAALAADIMPSVGLVTASPPFVDTGLVPVSDLVFGGHDIVDTPLVKRAERLANGGVLPAHLIPAVADRLAATDPEILAADFVDASSSPREALGAITAALSSFAARKKLDQVVVVNLTSTEAPADWSTPPATPRELDSVLDGDWDECPVSVVHAAAALEAGCAFVDFTPAVATRVPAIVAGAEERGIPLAGRDGKTGETLLKSVLAPMFADRALRVLSWAGTNLLGGGDGERLGEARFAASKMATKGLTLESILDYAVPAPVHIDNVPDLGDWKTAWDHVHFEGFLGTQMTLQFTWQGCDSSLAAPLVLDLVRLVARAREAGRAGLLPSLGFFFKDPVGSDEHRLSAQYAELCRWSHQL